MRNAGLPGCIPLIPPTIFPMRRGDSEGDTKDQDPDDCTAGRSTERPLLRLCPVPGNPELVCHTLPILPPDTYPQTEGGHQAARSDSTPTRRVADIILAAMEEAAHTPAPVKPMAPSTTGTDPTARAAGTDLGLAPRDRLPDLLTPSCDMR